MNTFRILLDITTITKDNEKLFRIHGLAEKAYTTSRINWTEFIAIQRLLSIKGLFTIKAL